MKLKLIALTLLAMLAGLSLAHAGSHTWTGAGANKLWSTSANWQNNSPPAVGEGNVALLFPPVVAAARNSTNNIAGLTINSVSITGTGYKIVGSPLTLGGYSAGIDNAGSTINTWGIDLALAARYTTVDVGSSGELNIAGALSGSGGPTKTGKGLLRLTPSVANTFSGTTLVLDGELDLKGLGAGFSAVSVSGDLVVGQTNPPAATYPFVYFENDNQIGDGSQVTVLEDGFIRLNGFSDLIGSMVLQAGVIDTRNPANTLTGTLSLGGNVSCHPHKYAAAVFGRISLYGADRTFDVEGGASLNMGAEIQHGFGTAGIIKIGDGEMYLYGANTFNGFTKVNAGVLGAVSGSALGTIANGTMVASGATLELSEVNVGNEALLLNGAGFGGTNGALRVFGTNSWSGNVLIGSDTTINLVNFTNDRARLTLSGVVSGSSELRVIGSGDAGYESTGALNYTGLSPNTHSGTTRVLAGSLELQKLPGANAVAGPLVLGDLINQNFGARVFLLNNYQIANSSPVTILPNGYFDLKDHYEDLADITMCDGYIDAGTGLLQLLGSMNTISNPAFSYGDSYIFGSLSLSATNRVFNIGTDSLLQVEATIIDGGNQVGIVKNGAGYLLFLGTNTYSGTTWVNEGFLELEHGGTPGSTAGGTIVSNGATLYLIDAKVANESLTIGGSGAVWDGVLPPGALRGAGTNTWTGNITLATNTTVAYWFEFGLNQIILTGNINGPGSLSQVGIGRLTLAGTSHNSYAGATRVLAGTLDLSKTNAVAVPGALFIGRTNNIPNSDVVRLVRANQISDSAAVYIDRTGLLDLNNNGETIGSLAGSGNVNLILGTLTTGGNNGDTTFDGGIGGVGVANALVKEGTGMFMLTGTNTYTGISVINNGSLCVNGWQPQNSIVVNDNGFFRGHGSVGGISGNGYTMPGDNPVVPTHGRMNGASLTLTANSDFNIDLAGTQEGVNYNQLKVSGTVSLGDAQLHLTRSFVPAVNDQFVIIRKDSAGAVTGQFKALPEGALFDYAPGWKFQITYKGGDGNDVVLTTIAKPAAADIKNISRYADGHMEMMATGTPGVTYDVLANTNVATTNWVVIGKAFPDALGQMYASDFAATNYPMRFYRFVAP